MPEEESLLAVCFRVHCNNGSARGEQNNVFAFLSGPLDIEAFVRLVTDDMFQLHYRVFVELVGSGELISTVLAGAVV